MPIAAAHLPDRLASLLDPQRTQSDPAVLAQFAIDEVTPSAVVQPASAQEAAEIVRFALAEKLALIPVGNRTKLAIGMPPSRYDIAMDMTALNRIAHYDPGDLTLSVDAGCTLLSIAAALSPQKQFLPLAPAFGPHATVAGTIASGVDSHLRQQYGTARDFLIGAEFIDGTGALCKSGGRVVKNVTGYDLHKLLIGSLGTLAVITRLNFRTFPSLSAAAAAGTFIASFADARSAIAFRQNIAASPFTPHTVEILSPGLAQLFAAINPRNWDPPAEPLGAWFSPQSWHVVVFFQGTPELCARYVSALTDFAHAAGALQVRNSPPGPPDDDCQFATEWRTLTACVVSALHRLRSVPGATIFKITQLPAKLPELFAALASAAGQAHLSHALFAHGQGLTYFALLPQIPPSPLNIAETKTSVAQSPAALNPEQTPPLASNDHKQAPQFVPAAQAQTPPPISSAHQQTIAQLATAYASIFSACSAQSANATILFAPTQLKRATNISGPPRPDAPAMHRLKSAFDSQNILAPARLS